MASIREMESAVRGDRKQANLMLDMRTALTAEDLPIPVRLAAMHALRRLLINILESGLLFSSSSVKDQEKDIYNEYKIWIDHQLKAYLGALETIVLKEGDELQAAAIRTMVEVVNGSSLANLFIPSSKHLFVTCQFVQREHLYNSTAVFGVETYTALFRSLLARAEVDVDILIALREEVRTNSHLLKYAIERRCFIFYVLYMHLI